MIDCFVIGLVIIPRSAHSVTTSADSRASLIKTCLRECAASEFLKILFYQKCFIDFADFLQLRHEQQQGENAVCLQNKLCLPQKNPQIHHKQLVSIFKIWYLQYLGILAGSDGHPISLLALLNSLSPLPLCFVISADIVLVKSSVNQLHTKSTVSKLACTAPRGCAHSLFGFKLCSLG